MPPTLTRLSNELGITTLRACSRDVYILLLSRIIRMLAYGSSTLILALHFAALGFSDTRIGLFMTLTLVGDVAISLVLTTLADTIGRRMILLAGALLMTFSGVVFASASNFWILLLAAVVGVISPSENEIGPFKAIEESTLAHLSPAEKRVDVFAWYTVFGTLGTARGTLLCGWLTQWLQTSQGWEETASYRLIFWIYAFIGLLKATLAYLLSPACELQAPFNFSDQPKANPPKSSLSPTSRIILLKLCSLFFLDSLASGMVPASLIAFFMERKFAMNRGTLGSILSAAAFVSSIGNIFAASIARRIGLVNTMVFTHLPSAVFLALVPFPASLWGAAACLITRASLSSMDQAPRSAFLAAVVKAEERTMVMGIVNTVKTMSQSGGPLVTGALAQEGVFWVSFVVAGMLKGSSDLGLLVMARDMRLEGEEKPRQQGSYEAMPLVEQVDEQDGDEEDQHSRAGHRDAPKSP